MDEAKRKSLEARLKQLIQEADQKETKNENPTLPARSSSGNVSVIRRRRGATAQTAKR